MSRRGGLSERLTYANVMATIAVFIALGGVSVAALKVPKGSVGARELKRSAVTKAKIKNGAVTGAKVRDGSITGEELALSTLGQVPSAVTAETSERAASAEQADRAEHSLTAATASEADFARTALNSALLGGFSGRHYGVALSAHANLPATDEDAEWWIPVSGLGQPQSAREDVEMILPVGQLFASRFAVYTPSGPDTAEVTVQLYGDGDPLVTRVEVYEGSVIDWPLDAEAEVEEGERLALRVVQETNGESIPEMPLATALFLTRTPG